jgi:flagellar motor switch protein FliN/FliY
MSEDHKLSQEEINALLNNQEVRQEGVDINEYLSVDEVDTMGEIGNISFGSAATVLSELLRQKVEITTPDLSLVQRSRLAEEFPHPHVAISVQYTKGFEGSNILVLKTKDAGVIADLMMGGDGTKPNEIIGEMEMSAVQEAMNQMMGSASTSMSAVFNKTIDISPPTADLLDFTEQKESAKLPFDDVMLKVMFRLKIGTLIDSNIMHLVPIDFAKEMVAELVRTEEIEQAETMASEIEQPLNDHSEPAGSIDESPNREPNNMPQTDRQHLGSSSAQTRDIQSAVFSDFEETEELRAETQNLNMLYDIPLQVTVELGRARRTVKDILRLTPGSVIELDKLAGEPVDIYVNNKMIAKGEVVVIDENFGVRVTEIASQKDRIQRLQ